MPLVVEDVVLKFTSGPAGACVRHCAVRVADEHAAVGVLDVLRQFDAHGRPALCRRRAYEALDRVGMRIIGIGINRQGPDGREHLGCAVERGRAVDDRDAAVRKRVEVAGGVRHAERIVVERPPGERVGGGCRQRCRERGKKYELFHFVFPFG